MDTQNITIFIQFLGGLGMFLFGMHVLATGLQKSAGAKMKRFLEILTKNKLMGVIVGCFVTGIIQSSSATTVMVVGFVNAGLMKLSQAVGVIMGANIGTTITGWIVASVEWAEFLKPDYFAPLFVALGAGMLLFSQNNKVKQTGEVIVGFGVLFMGMSFMTNSLRPLSSSPLFRSIFIKFGTNPLLGIGVGALVTAVIQSSSASVGILQALAAEGLVPINAAVYIIMGQNIGTCITAMLSSIGSSRTAKSAAYLHLLFNVMGSLIFSALAIFYFNFINVPIGNNHITLTQISLIHTAFNLANTLMLYNFSDLLIKIAEKMAGIGKEQESGSISIHLDDRILQNPSFALKNCEAEIINLGNMALKSLELSTSAILDKDAEKIQKVIDKESDIDKLTYTISRYLVKLCNSGISDDEKKFITSLFKTISDIERVGDHCENLVELAKFEDENNIVFSADVQRELKDFFEVTIKCFKHSITALDADDQQAGNQAGKKTSEYEKLIDVMVGKMRATHIAQLTNSDCDPVGIVVVLDVLTNLERVSDHALNIAEVVLGKRRTGVSRELTPVNMTSQQLVQSTNP